jgi:thiol-disulfide isomerase/thioredoxin
MSVQTFVGGAKKQDAKKALAQRPVLVLFYMIGCPHCEANKPAWEEAKKKVSDDVKIVEVDAEATPDDEGVSGFPTMKYKKGEDEEEEISGQKSSGEEILKELKAPKKKSGGRRTLRRSHGRRNRKFRHRTLRNYITLRQKFVGPSVLPKKR